MPVDNGLYNRRGDIWWDEREPLSTLRTMVNPGRVGYFRSVLVERLGRDPRGLRALDVGCGGGLLAEEFARFGCAVTGVDPSELSLETARTHAAASGLAIDYRMGSGEALPFDDAAFDLVYCCDVFEHVDSVERVIAEIARVLRPGGVFLYDTVNRTLLSRLIIVGVAQEWPATRFLPHSLHDWRMFIKPAELRAIMVRHGLVARGVVGLAPALNPLALLRALYLFRRGRLNYGQVGARLRFKISRDRAASYAGYALKLPLDVIGPPLKDHSSDGP
ncbi:MAG: bifunctional 2-polyprenyl-6-hydroxyphenol methylase/3-demethylubiquinol 3-O-methyltransferase UbiG [Chloroflexi bacterium]|nr:bifunctional 2-polyprenyl-6-hydroxyphenol methylase/3-demethylubiquinol 3-O-methyltransferase UbiG [Chloroflexota bacterium]